MHHKTWLIRLESFLKAKDINAGVYTFITNAYYKARLIWPVSKPMIKTQGSTR